MPLPIFTTDTTLDSDSSAIDTPDLALDNFDKLQIQLLQFALTRYHKLLLMDWDLANNGQEIAPSNYLEAPDILKLTVEKLRVMFKNYYSFSKERLTQDSSVDNVEIWSDELIFASCALDLIRSRATSFLDPRAPIRMALKMETLRDFGESIWVESQLVEEPDDSMELQMERDLDAELEPNLDCICRSLDCLCN